MSKRLNMGMSKSMSNFDDAITAFKNGDLIIVTDDADRENEGDLLLLAEKATPEKVAFMVRYTTGILCVALTEKRARDLQLPLMMKANQDPKKTAFTVSVDVKAGMTTGVSAEERSNTIQALASSTAQPQDFVRPGHVFPLIGHPGGLTARGGHTEAGLALAQFVGAEAATLLAELVNDDGSMSRGSSLFSFAAAHNLPVISIAELLANQDFCDVTELNNQPMHHLKELTSAFTFNWADLPLPTGPWQVATFPGSQGREHAVMQFGEARTTPMVRIHSECFTGDVMRSQRCDCGEQLEESIAKIQEHGFGYIVYVRDHEGRGIGLAEKIKAYRLQDEGMDTVDANTYLGHEIDARDWLDAISIIKALGVTRLIALTNNPLKLQALSTAGLLVTPQPLVIPANRFNKKYLATKVEKLGHTVH